MLQVVEAARHCYSRRVFHRDIKAENLLFNTDTMDVKLIDFGCGDLWQDTPYEEYAGNCTSRSNRYGIELNGLNI